MHRSRPVLALGLSLLLGGCAWNTVLTPFAVGTASTLPPSEVATVWGVRQGARLHFTHVNGESLPSRGGAGYPVSLTLPPGKHSLRVFFTMGDNRSMDRVYEAELKAGHTYVVEYLPIPGTPAVLLKLDDRGKNEQCHYAQTDELRGRPVLRCTGRAGG